MARVLAAQSLGTRVLIVATLLMGSVKTTIADSGTWIGGPLWSDGANWTGATSPGIGETATFDGQGTSNVDLGAGASVKSVVISGSNAYTIGTSSSQTLGVGGWVGMHLTTNNMADQTVAATLEVTANTLWRNNSTSSLTVLGDLTGAGNIWFEEGDFVFSGTNNTRTGGFRIYDGADVTAGSWNAAAPEQYHGSFTMNFDDTRDLDIGRTYSDGDFTYGIGTGNTITLNNHLKYTAATNGTANFATITGGTMHLGTDWRLIEVEDNAAITGQDAELVIHSEVYGGDTHHFSKRGLGTLRLTATNNAIGRGYRYLFIDEGTLQIEKDENLGTIQVTLGRAGYTSYNALEFIGKNNTTIDNQIKIAGTNGANHNVLANGAPGAALTLSAFHDNWANGGDKFTLGGANTDANTVSADMGIMDALVDGLDKTGVGTWRITADQTYTGPTAVQAGRLDFDGDNATAITVSDGATLGGEGSSSGNMVIGTSSGATLAIDGRTADAIGTTANLNSANGVDVLVEFAGPDPIAVVEYGTWTGNINDFTLAGGSAPFGSRGGAGTFTSIGNSIMINMGYAGRTWSGASSTHWDINTSQNWAEGDQLYLDGDPVTFGDTSAGDVDVQTAVAPLNVLFTNTSGNAYTLMGSTVTSSYGVTLDGDGDVTLNAVIAGAGALAKTADAEGTLVLNAANTYSGDTLIQAGTTIVSNSAAFGGGEVTLDDQHVSADTYLMLANGVNVTNKLIVTGASWVKRFGVEAGTTNHATWSGDIVSTESAADQFKIGAWGADETLELAGNITAPHLQIFNLGGGTVYLTGSNTITGTIHVRNWGAKLRLGNSAALGGGTTVLLDEKVTLQLEDGVSTPASGMLEVGDVTSNSKIVEILDGDSGTDEFASFGGGISIGENSTGTFSVVAQLGDTLQFGGSISGTGTAGIVKSGGGDAILNGLNTYSNGMIDVQAGALWLNGNGDAATGMLVVNAGTKLGGMGSWGGDVTVSNGATFGWSLESNTLQDGFDVLGDATFEGNHDVALMFNGVGSSVNWSNELWATEQTWTILDVGGTFTTGGAFTLVNENWLDSDGQALQSVRGGAGFSLQTSAQSVTLRYSEPPPPGLVFIVR